MANRTPEVTEYELDIVKMLSRVNAEANRRHRNLKWFLVGLPFIWGLVALPLWLLIFAISR